LTAAPARFRTASKKLVGAALSCAGNHPDFVVLACSEPWPPRQNLGGNAPAPGARRLLRFCGGLPCRPETAALQLHGRGSERDVLQMPDQTLLRILLVALLVVLVLSPVWLPQLRGEPLPPSTPNSESDLLKNTVRRMVEGVEPRQIRKPGSVTGLSSGVPSPFPLTRSEIGGHSY